MHSVLGQRKRCQKQYIAIGKTDFFYNSMGPCGNFTEKSIFFISEGGKYKPNSSGLRKYANPINIQGRGFLSTRF